MAEAIKNNIEEEDMQRSIEKVELSKIGKGPDDKSGYFLNVFLKDFGKETWKISCRLARKDII